MADIQVTDNSGAVISEMEKAVEIALKKIGMKAEGYAKLGCPVGTPESTGIPGYIGGTLRNSITYDVDDDAVYIGTNVKYAVYVEFNDKAKHLVGGAHYLRNAVTDHIDEYQNILTSTLKSGH